MRCISEYYEIITKNSFVERISDEREIDNFNGNNSLLIIDEIH